MEKVLIAQVIAHIIADFFAQPEHYSLQKQMKGLSSRHIYIHALIVFTASFIMTFTYRFIFYALIIMITHFLIDLLKSIIERRFKRIKGIGCKKLYTNHYIFILDQILHLCVIYGVVSVYFRNIGYLPSYLDFFSLNQLLIVLGLMLCMKPANVLIRCCLSSLDLHVTNNGTEQEKNDLERAGRWIGTIERIMALVLVMLQQYTAIGFIIAAKSVLRYNDSKTGKTEYVLIGTLLSFSIALFIGIGIQTGLFA